MKNEEMVKKNKKIKMLFDGQQLAKAFIQQQSGVFRVSHELFRRLCKREDVEIYFLMTTSKGEPEKYLKSIGHPEIKIIRMPLLYKTTKYFRWHKIYCGFLRLVMPFFYNDKLREFDIYFSPHPPISEIVYNSGIKTACICYDIIPLLFPDFVSNCKKSLCFFQNNIKKLAADCIFFDSESARRDFLTYRTDFPFEKTLVAYPGTDSLDDATKLASINDDDSLNDNNNDDLSMIRKKYKIPEKRYVFTLSESNPRKNFDHVIRSFCKYLEGCEDHETNLVIGGKKLKGYDYINMTNGLFEKYKDRIIITGYITNADLSAIYKGASLFLFPSLYEGFGLPPLEAMKYKVPVIAGNNSSMPEIYGDAAVYVSGFSDEETAGAIKKILSDADFAAKMIKKGTKRSSMFSFNKMTEDIMNRIRVLINER